MPLSRAVFLSTVVAFLVGAAIPSAPEAQERCVAPGPACGATVNSNCLGALGAGSIAVDAAGGDCKSQLASYTGCLARAIEECGQLAGGMQRLGQNVALDDIDGVPILASSLSRGVYDPDARALVDTLNGLADQIVYLDMNLSLALGAWRTSERTMEEAVACQESGDSPSPDAVAGADEVLLLPDTLTEGPCADLADINAIVALRFLGDESDYIYDVAGCGTECVGWRYAGLFRVQLPLDHRSRTLPVLNGQLAYEVGLQAIGGEAVLQNRAARRAREMKQSFYQ